jgi:hypothetical protein
MFVRNDAKVCFLKAGTQRFQLFFCLGFLAGIFSPLPGF